MNKYRVIFYNNLHYKTKFLEYMEWDAEHLTKERFHQIIENLFFWAASSCVYEDMKAVIERNGKEIMTIKCKTITDGSTITANISSDGRHLREMTVAA